MKEVRRVGFISVANLYGLISAIIGLIMGLITAGMSCGIGATSGIPFGGFGFIGVILLPIIYGAIGWVSGIIGAALYNLLAGLVGGIKIDLEE